SRRWVCMLVESLTRGGDPSLWGEIVLTRGQRWPERSAAFRPWAGAPLLTAGQLLRNSCARRLKPAPSPRILTPSRASSAWPSNVPVFSGKTAFIRRTGPNRTLFTRENRSGRRNQTRSPARRAATAGPAVPDGLQRPVHDLHQLLPRQRDARGVGPGFRPEHADGAESDGAHQVDAPGRDELLHGQP